MVIRGGTIINIAGTTPVDDPAYRYKMPAVFGKVEGSGNGIKTAIPNISDVALSLHRSPAEVNKFFGTELGAQTRYNADTDRAIVNGAHKDIVLQELIHRYIEKFVLCPNCRLPESEYKIKNDTVYHRCKACGAKEMVDMSHKLCNFILAEDKKAKKENKGKKDDKGKDSKKKKKSKDDSDDDKKKAKKEKKKAKKEKKDKEKKEESGGADYIAEALAGGKKDEDDIFGAGTGSSDDEDDDDSERGVDDEGALELAVDATQKFIDGNPDCSVKALADTISNQQMASALKSHDKVHILVRAVFTSAVFKEKQVEKYAPLISALTNGNRIMERHLISALEAFCMDKPKNFPVMLKQLWDEDALAEETILEWADEGRTDFTLEKVDEDTRSVLRGEAEPVVVWLQEADSDSDDD